MPVKELRPAERITEELRRKYRPGEPIPKYYQIKKIIKSQIDGGALKPGDKLPSVYLLADQLHVTKVTADKAFAELEKDGLVKRAQGRGTFVAEPAPEPAAGHDSGDDAPGVRAPSRHREGQTVVNIVYKDLPSKRIGNNLFRMVLCDFQDRHPEVSLHLVPEPQDFLFKREDLILRDLFRKYAISSMFLSHDFVRDLAYHRQIADISRQAAPWDKAGAILDAAWDACRWDNGVYGIPFTTDLPFVVVYRPAFKKLLGSDAGIEKCFSSWEAVRDLRASAAGKKRGVNVFCNGAERLFCLWQHILVQRGTGPFERESPSSPPLIGPEGASALGLVQDLLRTGTLRSVEQVDTAELFSAFTGGIHPALFISSPGGLLALLQRNGVPESDVAILPLPAAKGGKQVQLLLGYAWSFSPYLSPEDLQAAVGLAEYISDPAIHDIYHKRLADVFPETEREYWRPLGKDLSGWDRLTPHVQGSWKEYIKTWLPKAVAKPTAPFWTLGVFEDDLRKLARSPELDVGNLLVAHRQEASLT